MKNPSKKCASPPTPIARKLAATAARRSKWSHKTARTNIHGSAFIKIDRPGLNAFQRYNGPGGPKADLRVSNRFNQIGGSVGGPIIKNHLFVFFSYETLRNSAVNPNTTWAETPQFLTQAPGGSIANALLAFPGE